VKVRHLEAELPHVRKIDGARHHVRRFGLADPQRFDLHETHVAAPADRRAAAEDAARLRQCQLARKRFADAGQRGTGVEDEVVRTFPVDHHRDDDRGVVRLRQPERDLARLHVGSDVSAADVRLHATDGQQNDQEPPLAHHSRSAAVLRETPGAYVSKRVLSWWPGVVHVMS
jgi:hypothetical protein